MPLYRFGTSHFINVESAEKYYKPYGYELWDVEEMIRQKTISIGPPTNLGTNESLVLIDGGKRYAIEVFA